MNTEQVINWLTSEAMRNTTYHNHKENMAWVATALYLTGSIAGGFTLNNTNDYLAIILFILISFGAFFFVNWQFCKRWLAAAKVEALIRTIASFGQTAPKDLDWTIDDDNKLPKFVVKNIQLRFDGDRIYTQIISNLVMAIGAIFFIARVYC